MNIPMFQSHFSMSLQDAEGQINDVRKKISSLLIPHHLEIKNNGRPINLVIDYTELQNVFICYFDYQAESIVRVEHLSDYYIIEIPLSGTSETIRGRDRFISSKGQAAIVSPGTHFRTQWSDDCTKLLIVIRREAFEQQISDMLSESVKEPVQFELGLDLREKNGVAWWRAMQYIIKELECQAVDSRLNMHLNKHLEQTLIWSLALNHVSNYSHSLHKQNDFCQPKFLKKVEDYINAHCAEALTIHELAKVAGVSVPRLFSGFRKYKGITPMKYLTNIRFERVHNTLKKAEHGALVSEIAMKWGFCQLGRFSREYKKRYGETPSHTLKN